MGGLGDTYAVYRRIKGGSSGLMGALGDTYAYKHTGRYKLDAVDQPV
jgi:hypothetical protein